MTETVRSLAVFTVVYPGVQPFLGAWWHSIGAQTDRDFELWVASDGLSRDEFERHAVGIAHYHWIESGPGDTPASLRSRALIDVCRAADAVVLVDSDDILLPTRAAAARAHLADADLVACGLRLVDAEGTPIGQSFAVAGDLDLVDAIVEWNAFGFSNSAYRARMLEACLPVPPKTVLMDWLVATRAWLAGARIRVDPRECMSYRRYGRNLASVGPPYQPVRIAADARLVAQHLGLALGEVRSGSPSARLLRIEQRKRDVDRFVELVAADMRRLEAYTEALASIELPALWWATVAHPRLARFWSEEG